MDVVLLAVHWSLIDDVLDQAGDLAGKLIMTCSLPMNDRNTDLLVAHTASGAEVLADRLPNAQVVAALNTVPSEVLGGVYGARAGSRRPSLLFCGDDATAKATVAGIIRDVGFEPLDAGPLRIARYTEPFALLVGQLAYEGANGPAMAYRFEWLGA
jgi:predicted dinucleotide-binding enzyme